MTIFLDDHGDNYNLILNSITPEGSNRFLYKNVLFELFNFGETFSGQILSVPSMFNPIYLYEYTERKKFIYSKNTLQQMIIDVLDTIDANYETLTKDKNIESDDDISVQYSDQLDSE